MAVQSEHRDELFRSETGLVGWIVRHSTAPYRFHDDLIQDGLLALWIAADTYDPDTGVPFRAYAAMKIRWGITDAMRALDHLKRHHRDQVGDLAPPPPTQLPRHLPGVEPDHADDVAFRVDLDRALDEIDWWPSFVARRVWIDDAPVRIVAGEVERSEAWVWWKLREARTQLTHRM